eukprot:6177985-Pleurochrysis_carterae.AAC.9
MQRDGLNDDDKCRAQFVTGSHSQSTRRRVPTWGTQQKHSKSASIARFVNMLTGLSQRLEAFKLLARNGHPMDWGE